jgi:hypothetical protein
MALEIVTFQYGITEYYEQAHDYILDYYRRSREVTKRDLGSDEEVSSGSNQLQSAIQRRCILYFRSCGFMVPPMDGKLVMYLSRKMPCQCRWDTSIAIFYAFRPVSLSFSFNLKHLRAMDTTRATPYNTQRRTSPTSWDLF